MKEKKTKNIDCQREKCLKFQMHVGGTRHTERKISFLKVKKTN